MALTGEEKLKNFAAEAMGEAKKISGEIEARTKSELNEKLSEGQTKINERINGHIRHETEKIKKEQSLAASQAEIRTKHDYLKYIDSISEKTLGLAAEKLKDFANSEKYPDYLFECCSNVLQKFGPDMDIFYRPSDEEIMISQIKKRLGALFTLSGTVFIADKTIKKGGLKFLHRDENVFINDAFEEKTERAKKLLHSMIGQLFAEVK